MSVLKKLLKTTDGLQDDVDAIVEKAVATALKERNKEVKTALKSVTAAAKEAGHDKPTKAAVLLTINALAEELAA
jgi:hypothetical protein